MRDKSGTIWVSSPRMTFAVDIDKDGIITEAAPIARVFIGQHIKRLRRWMESHGEFRWKRLT
jgi:hypothetical protein